MPDTTHTPGPWVVDLESEFLLGGDCISVEAANADGTISREICTLMVDTDDHPNGPNWQEDAANARLIAAAPELLDALKRVVFIADRKTVEFDAARAAIAKAEGKSGAGNA